MSTLVVIPTYNEISNLPALIPAIHSNLSDADILILDDNSPDGTGAWCDETATHDKQLFVLHRQAKQGLGRAYVAGFQWALAHHYDRIIQMDADFSHDPKDLPRLLEAMQDADVVIGSRYTGGCVRVLNWPLRRLFLSVGASYYVKLFTRLPIADPTGGFKVFNRTVLEAIGLDTISSEGYVFQIEMNLMAWRKGFKIKEIPIVFADRLNGTSKMSLRIALEAIWQVPRLALQMLMHKR